MFAFSIVASNGANIATGHKTLKIRSWHPPAVTVAGSADRREPHLPLPAKMKRTPDGVAVAGVDVEEVHV